MWGRKEWYFLTCGGIVASDKYLACGGIVASDSAVAGRHHLGPRSCILHSA